MALSRTKVWIAEVLTYSDLNAEFNGILNNALSLISPLTGALAAGGFKITGLGAGTDRTDAASLATIQDGTGIYVATVGGTADVITLTPSPAITAYAAGQAFFWIASGANTTNVTVNVSAVGAKAVTKNGSTALVANDIASGSLIGARYDGTRFQLIGPGLATGPSTLTGTITGTYTLAGTGTFTNPANTTQALTDGANIAWNAASGGVATVTLGGNRTMDAPSNLRTGGRYVLHVTQDGTGGRTLAFNAVFINQGSASTLPNPAGAASSKTTYVFDSPDGTNLQLVNLVKRRTRQVLTSGTAATYTTPTGCTQINVRAVGPGGGGGAQTTNSGAAGSAATTFSGGTMSAGAGAGGGTGAAGGAGGATSGGDINIAGGIGGPGYASGANISIFGGNGAPSALGGAGAGGIADTAGSAAATNSGSGGGGAGATGTGTSGGGGGAGGYCERVIISPAATYTYTIGTGGAGGAAGAKAGGNGADGIIIVDEWYG